MKKTMFAMFLVVSCLLCACTPSRQTDFSNTPSEVESTQEPTKENIVPIESVPVQNKTISKLEKVVLSILNDYTIPISFEKENVFVDDTGKMMLEFEQYDFDKYDMVDITDLSVGDTIETNNGNIVVNTLDQKDNGYIYINEDDELNFILLIPDDGYYYSAIDCTSYFVPKYYVAGSGKLPVDGDKFTFTDSFDIEKGEFTYYAGDLLTESEVIIWSFNPRNTSMRVADGKVVELTRIYVP